jgi:RND family efflux transporter MFP subunit
MSGLRKSGAITQSDMDKVNDGHRMGLAKIDAAQAQTKLASVGLAAAQTKLSDTTMKAPFSGVVLQRLLDEGSVCTVMPPSPVAVIAEVDTMKVEGAVSERDRLSVKVGMPAKVIVDALRGKVLTGTVAIINPMVDPRTRTATIQINLPNPDHVLETGMSAGSCSTSVSAKRSLFPTNPCCALALLSARLFSSSTNLVSPEDEM